MKFWPRKFGRATLTRTKERTERGQRSRALSISSSYEFTPRRATLNGVRRTILHSAIVILLILVILLLIIIIITIIVIKIIIILILIMVVANAINNSNSNPTCGLASAWARHATHER